MLNWQDVFEIRASQNVRRENVYDVYKKGTNDMIWADIPVDKIDEMMKWLAGFADKIITKDMDELFSGETKPEPAQDKRPLEVKYNRLKNYPQPALVIDDEEK